MLSVLIIGIVIGASVGSALTFKSMEGKYTNEEYEEVISGLFNENDKLREQNTFLRAQRGLSFKYLEDM